MRDFSRTSGAGSTILERESLPEGRCQHHWILGAPMGPTSTGLCKRCGASKEFANASPDWVWDSDLALTWLAGTLVEWRLPQPEPGGEE